jgi:hypothetical protein
MRGIGSVFRDPKYFSAGRMGNREAGGGEKKEN